MAFKVGLTGNIGAGKTLACDYFAQLGACVIDADHIVHDLLDNPSKPIVAFAKEHAGAGALDHQGRINRAHMRSYLVKHPNVRKKWEALLEPTILERLQDLPPTDTYHILAIPLLFEHNLGHMVDRTCLIRARYELLYQRICNRNGWSDDHIEAILALQMPATQQALMADDVIDNNSDQDTLKDRVILLHERYLTMAKKSNGICK